MNGGGSVTHWLDELATDEASVAQRELFGRYFEKLVEVARRRLQAASRSAQDEEDLALSAMNSFFCRAASGQFPQLSRRHELWSLLVTIVRRKAVNQIKRDGALKRGGAPNERSQIGPNEDSQAGPFTEPMADEPAPEVLAALNEELQRRLASLDGEMLRDIALLRLQGFTNVEIAERLGMAERTVRRKIYRIRREWTDTLD